MKKILVTLGLCLAMGLSFWAGNKARDKHWANAIEHWSNTASREARHHKLTDLRTCFYAVEADTLRFAVLLEKEYLTTVVDRATLCRNFIEGLGEGAEDEDFSRAMGEMLLFYDSYVETIKEILARQIMFQTLYNDAAVAGENLEITQELRDLAADQRRAIEDTRRFLDEFDGLIQQVW